MEIETFVWSHTRKIIISMCTAQLAILLWSSAFRRWFLRLPLFHMYVCMVELAICTLHVKKTLQMWAIGLEEGYRRSGTVVSDNWISSPLALFLHQMPGSAELLVTKYVTTIPISAAAEIISVWALESKEIVRRKSQTLPNARDMINFRHVFKLTRTV